MTSLQQFSRQAFSVVGLMTWNSLPDNLRDPVLSDDKFRAPLKNTLFLQVSEHAHSAYKCTITYLLTW